MDIKQLLINSNQKLLKTGIKSAYLDGVILLSYILNKPKEFLYSYPEKKLTPNQVLKFNQLITRRTKGEPIAYLINHKEFFGLDFYVNKDVLIPRPETELLVENILNITKNINKKITIADIGTGSGAIIIALAKNIKLKNIEYLATDISLPAIKIAKKNAKKLQVKIKFYSGDLLKPIISKNIDIIVSNPPYGDKILWSKRKSYKTIGLKYEPHLALYAKDHGLAIYKKLFAQIQKLKHNPSYFFGEIDESQNKKIVKLAKACFPSAKIELKKDLAGLFRLIQIKFD